MTTKPSTQELLTQLNGGYIKMGTLKKMAKEIKRDHTLALELWASEQFYARMLAVLIMDKKLLTQDVLEQLADDLQIHTRDEQVRIADWLLANQLMKSKKTTALVQSWETASSPILRRLFWYHQGRLRWTGQTPPDNTENLLASLDAGFVSAEPEVQWAMNFTAGQIGIFDVQYRSRCIELGEKTGLYKDEPVSHGCTPNYLPEFIRIEAAKRNL